MRICVLLKPVAEGTGWRIGSLDHYALSHAIELRDSTSGEVEALILASDGSEYVAQRALASGADSATIIQIDQTLQSAVQIALLACDHLTAGRPDLVLSGQSSDDIETGLVGAMIAELLDHPYVGTVTTLRHEDQHIVVQRDLIGSKHLLRVATPAVLGILSARDITLRYPSPRGMIAARRKPVTRITPTSAAPADLAWSTPVAPERHGDGELLQGLSPEATATRVVDWLEERGLRS